MEVSTGRVYTATIGGIITSENGIHDFCVNGADQEYCATHSLDAFGDRCIVVEAAVDYNSAIALAIINSAIFCTVFSENRVRDCN